MSARIRVMLADDHAVVRAGYRFFLENIDDIEVVAEAASGEDALARYADVNPDVLVMDLTMPGIGGMEAIRQLIGTHPGAKVLVFTMHENAALVEHALQAGASGYISKNSAPESLTTAVRRIAAGNTYIDSELAQNMVVQQSRGQREALAGLSTRELQILRLFAEARSIEEIAESLSLSTKTISNYLTQIKDKLHVSSSTELVRLAISKGLVTV
ncbi:MAG: response regulator transcription factor [Pseudomonadota bacterium]|nr:response regulator transcription factor [Pseudomonadota bacterium]